MPRRFDRASPLKVPLRGVACCDFQGECRPQNELNASRNSKACTVQRTESSDCDSKTADKSCKSGNKREIRCRAATEPRATHESIGKDCASDVTSEKNAGSARRQCAEPMSGASRGIDARWSSNGRLPRRIKRTQKIIQPPRIFRGVHMSFRADKIYALRIVLARKNYLCNQQVIDLKRGANRPGTAVAIPPADVADALRVMFP